MRVTLNCVRVTINCVPVTINCMPLQCIRVTINCVPVTMPWMLFFHRVEAWHSPPCTCNSRLRSCHNSRPRLCRFPVRSCPYQHACHCVHFIRHCVHANLHCMRVTLLLLHTFRCRVCPNSWCFERLHVSLCHLSVRLTRFMCHTLSLHLFSLAAMSVPVLYISRDIVAFVNLWMRHSMFYPLVVYATFSFSFITPPPLHCV